MAFQSLEITKDGMTYCIEAQSHDGARVEALLREDHDGWHLTECTRGVAQRDQFTRRLGRRKRWIDALSIALGFLADHLGTQH